MKTCGKCKRTLDISLFHRDSSKKDGLRTTCKDCKKASDSAYASSNAPEIAKKRRERYLRRYEIEREQQRIYAKENVECYRKNARRYRQNNKGKVNAATRKRQASKLKATPSWLTEKQLRDIQIIYTACTKVTERTGKSHHVDHIVPLQGKNVCGLHVPWNLAIIPASMNLAKSNTY